jgi:hypothetical protein
MNRMAIFWLALCIIIFGPLVVLFLSATFTALAIYEDNKGELTDTGTTTWVIFKALVRHPILTRKAYKTDPDTLINDAAKGFDINSMVSALAEKAS